MVKWKRIKDFILITFIANFSLAGLFFILDQFTGLWDSSSNAMTVLGILYMLIPATVAIVLIKKNYKGTLKEYGLTFRFNPYWVLAWIIPILIVTGTICVSVLLRFGTLDLSFSEFLEGIKAQMGEEVYAQAKEQLEKAGIIIMSLQAIIAGTTINALLALGEEMGWRGFLYTELKPLGFWKSGILTGFIWGIWHTPLILMGHNFPDHPYIGVLVMTAACIPLGILIHYVREKTKTVAAAAVTHGMFNGVSGFAVIAVKGGDNLLKLTLGISGIIATGILVLILVLIMKLFRGAGIDQKEPEFVPDPADSSR